MIQTKKFNPIHSNKRKKKSINQPKKVKTDKKFQAWPCTAARFDCDEWGGVEITNYFLGLTNDLGQCYATLLSIHSSYYFLQGD